MLLYISEDIVFVANTLKFSTNDVILAADPRSMLMKIFLALAFHDIEQSEQTYYYAVIDYDAVVIVHSLTTLLYSNIYN